MSTGEGSNTAYDVVRYPSFTHASTHVDRLAVRARLYGLDPAPAGACRVLELGCGDGTNLVPMAAELPGSRFVGVDLAADRIAEARGMAAALGVGNIEFVHADVGRFDPGPAEFDYVIAHGLYSWVPPEVRTAILALAGRLLAPEGVAFVSYVAMPGSLGRQMLRDVLHRHVAGITDPQDVLVAARQVVEYLAIPNESDDPFQALLRAEASRFLQADPAYSFHDDLSPWCAPQWFTDFVADAAVHGLQFLTEAEPIEMEDHLVAPEARGSLHTFGTDRIRRQQYLDHHRARRFRQTLLCRADRAPTDEPDPARLRGLLLATGPGERGTVIDLAPDVEVTFGLADSVSVSTSYSLGKAALAVLLAESPGRLAFADLDARARDVMCNLGDGGPSDHLATFLLTMYGASFVKVHEVPTTAVGHVTERPRVGRVARWQAAHDRTLSTLNHFSLTFSDPRKREMVTLVDGTRTVAELAAEWAARGLADAPEAAPADEGVAEFLSLLVEHVVLDG